MNNETGVETPPPAAVAPHKRYTRNSLALMLGAGLVLGYVGACGTTGTWLNGPTPNGQPTPAPSETGWINLLDKENAKNWKNVTDDAEIFEIANNELHIFGKTLFPLRYVAYGDQTFSDFDLHIEYKVERKANSGVFLRAHPDDPVVRGFEVQVLDDFGRPPNRHTSGAIYDVVSPMHNMSRPRGQWNSFDISVVNKEISVRMNGWLVVTSDFGQMTEPLGKFKVPYTELPLEGLLALQDHGGEVWYRNIWIRKR
ncbi:MAG: hypothetical protein AMXMBFR84_06890 [Candidatus Hydrogenedentota bacterium]